MGETKGPAAYRYSALTMNLTRIMNLNISSNSTDEGLIMPENVNAEGKLLYNMILFEGFEKQTFLGFPIFEVLTAVVIAYVFVVLLGKL